MRICFATNNPNKIKEIKSMLGDQYKVLSLEEIGCLEELPETQDTLEGNSAQKAQYVWDHFQVPCFADDTGLEVEILDGQPGVYSARFAGPQRDSEDNMSLLLQKLEGQDNRSAQFRTCITLILEDGKGVQFQGVVKGKISKQKQGKEGFGYDPIFVPDGYEESFAEMSLSQKNTISHRKRALEQLINHLSSS